MSLIAEIQGRVSCPRLTDPAPPSDVLEDVFQCALRAPDHMRLRPWRYLVIEGEQREDLGRLFVEGATRMEGSLTDSQAQKYQAMPLRAPVIVVAVSENQSNDKVPEGEQIVSCGVGVGYMLLALQSAGYGGIWRTGPLAENAYVKSGLGLQANETLVGFLYIGTPIGDLKPVPELKVEDYFHAWSGTRK